MKKIIKNNKKLIIRRHENAASQFYHDLHNSQNLTKKNCALLCFTQFSTRDGCSLQQVLRQNLGWFLS